jgi:predicted acetyltransferase
MARDRAKPAERLELTEPTAELAEAFRAMAADYAAAGEDLYQDLPADFGEYVRKLRDEAAGRRLRADGVPQQSYWLVRDGPEGREIVGCARLRTRLNEIMQRQGGHIGYDVRPGRRGRGYGTALLALTLEKARHAGLDRVLITCAVSNPASAGVIENNRGVLEGQVYSTWYGENVYRYWIEL